MSMASKSERLVTSAPLLFAALSLLGAAGCANEVDPRESSTMDGEANDAKAASSDDEGAKTGAVSQALPIGGGGGGASCSAPPLQCGGSTANRGIYPGCSVSCRAGETPMCMPGDCFWHRAPICTCQRPIHYP
jgi:hypothetical protein